MTAALQIVRHADADAFLEAAQRWLLEAEAENDFLLGIALNVQLRPASEARPYFASIHERNEIVGCACRTPPHRLVLSRLPTRAVGALADDAGSTYSHLNGVTGPAAEAESFARAWTARHGGGWRTAIRMRLYELTHVVLPSHTVSGSLRKATDADLGLAREWVDGYVRDTGIDGPAGDMAQRLIERGQLFFWIDGGNARAMVAATRETRSGCAINTVYTTPSHRRRGYLRQQSQR
jgi:uncharacterized protein